MEDLQHFNGFEIFNEESDLGFRYVKSSRTAIPEKEEKKMLEKEFFSLVFILSYLLCLFLFIKKNVKTNAKSIP